MKRSFLLITMITSALVEPAHAGDFALSSKAGLVDYRLEGTTNIFSNLNARFGYNAYRYSAESDISGNKLNIEMELQTATLLLDLYPMDSAFRLSAGITFNGKQADLQSRFFASSTAIGGSPYSSISLDRKIELTPIAPYLGIGWGNTFADNKGWGFNIDFGVMLQGESDLELSALGDPTIVNSRTFQNDIKKESDNTEDESKTLDLYPVFSFGISYKF